jgi:MFS family permease
MVTMDIVGSTSDMTDAIMSVAMVGRLCIGAVYSVIILYTAELFPTANRNAAVGTSSTMSHVGSILAPYIVDLLVSCMSISHSLHSNYIIRYNSVVN